MNIKSSQDLVNEAEQIIETIDPYKVKLMTDNNECTLIDIRDIRELWKFTDVSGIGMYTEFQQNLHRGLQRNFSHLIDLRYGYWGGAIWRLEREWRIKLRNLMNMGEMVQFNKGFEDEGMMARLATLAKIPNNAQVLPGGFRWCHCSYREGIETAEMIHIRPKVTPIGPKRPKIENYREMVKRGLIEE